MFRKKIKSEIGNKKIREIPCWFNVTPSLRSVIQLFPIPTTHDILDTKYQKKKGRFLKKGKYRKKYYLKFPSQNKHSVLIILSFVYIPKHLKEVKKSEVGTKKKLMMLDRHLVLERTFSRFLEVLHYHHTSTKVRSLQCLSWNWVKK